MTLRTRIAAAVLVSLPLAALAQQAPRQPDPVDQNAAVPGLHYESALQTYKPAKPEGDPSPDKTWRRANEQVAGAGSPSGHHAAAPAPTHAGASAGGHHKHN